VSAADWMVLTISVSLVTLLGLEMWLGWHRHDARDDSRMAAHETRAEAREKRAQARHDSEMKALDHNRALTLKAIDQRMRVEDKLRWVVVAIADHADHLEALGRPRPLRDPPPERSGP